MSGATAILVGVVGRCGAKGDKAVPTLTSWRLAELPRFLTSAQVDHLIAACDGASSDRYAGVERRRVELLVSEQHLDDADVGLLLQEMGGEAVALIPSSE